MVYAIRSKDEVFGCFRLFEAMVTAKFGVQISRLKCDNGGEYRSAEFDKFCKQKGIEMQFTVPYTPEQNGVAERMNRTLEEKARSMLFSSGADKKFWCEAVETAAYLVNRSPASAIVEGKTPYELWEGRKPDVSVMRVWGSPVYCHIPKEHRRKLDRKAWKGVFLGYHCNGYRVWDPKRGKVVVARDVIVDELSGVSNDFENSNKPPMELVRIKRLADSDSSDSEMEDGEHELEQHQDSEHSLEQLGTDLEETVEEFEDCGEVEGSGANEAEGSAGANRQPSVETSGRKRVPPVWQKDYEMNFAAWTLSAVSYVKNFPDTLIAEEV